MPQHHAFSGRGPFQTWDRVGALHAHDGLAGIAIRPGGGEPIAKPEADIQIGGTAQLARGQQRHDQRCQQQRHRGLERPRPQLCLRPRRDPADRKHQAAQREGGNGAANQPALDRFEREPSFPGAQGNSQRVLTRASAPTWNQMYSRGVPPIVGDCSAGSRRAFQKSLRAWLKSPCEPHLRRGGARGVYDEPKDQHHQGQRA